MVGSLEDGTFFGIGTPGLNDPNGDGFIDFDCGSGSGLGSSDYGYDVYGSGVDTYNDSGY